MAWRQIPYPPDHPPPTSANDPIILERSGLRLELDPLSGDLVALSAPGIGLDLLPGDARITFRLMSHEHLWLEGSSARPTFVRTDDSERIEVVYERPERRWVIFPVRMTLRYEIGGGGSSPRNWCALRARAPEVPEGSDAGIVKRVHFVVQGLPEIDGERTELLLPFIGGERRPAPLSGEWSPSSTSTRTKPCPGCSSTTATGASTWRARIRSSADGDARPNHPEAHSCSKPSCSSRPAPTSGPARSSPASGSAWPYAGTWHTAADRYRAWLDTWWEPPTMPDEVRGSEPSSSYSSRCPTPTGAW